MKSLFWFGVVFIAVLPIIIGIGFENTSISWVAAVCGVFIVFISKIEKVAEISFGPIKAKMKETIDEANLILDRLRLLSVTLSEGFLNDLMAGNFCGGMSIKERFNLHDKVIKCLESIDIDNELIVDAESGWRRGVCLLYVNSIKKTVGMRESQNIINFNAPKENKNAVEEVKGMIVFDKWVTPTPKQIRDVLKKYGIKDELADKKIEDLEHYISTNQTRNYEYLFEK